VKASSEDLTSLGIAISKMRERMGEKVLLVFDSLTTPYLMSGSEILRFMRTTLLRAAAEGDAVLACVDEGCGKEEDLTAMMSTADGIIKMEIKDGRRVMNVVKHPKVEPAMVEVSTTKILEKLYDAKTFDVEMFRRYFEGMRSGSLTRDLGQFAVSVFWPNLARWSGILWDPKRFPEMLYDINAEAGSFIREAFSVSPWYVKLWLKLFMPKNFSKVKDMKKLLKSADDEFMKQRRWGVMEYLEDVSKTDEHYVRVYEYYECCGFENVGTPMAISALWIPAMCKGLERERREWNTIETKCIGLGDPYCEFKAVPGEIDELKDSLEKDSSDVERIHERLMQRIIGFLVDGKPLVERPKLGSNFLMFFEMAFPALASERYRMALRLGGVKTGMEVGERLLDAGISENEAVKRILNFLEYCKVGKVTANKTIRIRDNCESLYTKFYATKLEEPTCFFTTGFLNGFFSAVKNQHVKETKCIAMGDPYCEWEFR
jgi:predicted hydrocarbon binding protein